jgi:hypothetical protein
MSEQQLKDLGVNFIRPQLATIQGASLLSIKTDARRHET